VLPPPGGALTVRSGAVPRRFRPALAVAVALSFGAGACSDDESVFNAEVGECIESLADLSGSITELPEASCDEDHEGEIFFLVEHEGDDDEFPGTDDVESEAREECEGDEFEDYVGVPYDETPIALAYITPSEDSWGDGDRETICVLTLAGERVDESFEGNGEDFPFDGGGSSGSSGDGSEAGEPEDPPSIDDPALADLAEQCFDGSGQACDTLFFQSPAGSEAEDYGNTCGHRFPGSPGLCATAIGE
jgi:hypothetical protein